MGYSFEMISAFTGHTGGIYALRINTKTQRFYTGGADGMVVEWDPQKPEEGRLLTRLPQPVYAILLPEDSGEVWIGAASGNLHVVDLNAGKEIKNFQLHTHGIYNLLEVDGKVFAAGGDGVISVWDKLSGSLIRTVKFAEKSIRTLAYDAVNRRIAAGSSDHSIGFFSTDLFQLDILANAHNNSVFALTFSNDGRELFSGGRDAILKKWEVADPIGTATLLQEVPAHNLHIHSLALHEQGELLLSSSMDKTVKLWNTKDLQLLKVIDPFKFKGHVSSVNRIRWINNDHFVSAGDDRKAVLWRLQN